MPSWARAITHINSADPEVRRRGRILVTIALSMALIALALIIHTLINERDAGLSLITLSVAALCFASTALLGRAGMVNIGSFVLIGFALAGIVYWLVAVSQAPHTLFFLVVPVLLAGLLLPPVHVWTIFALAMLGVWLVSSTMPAELRTEPHVQPMFLGAFQLLSIVSIVSFLGANATRKAMEATQSARSEAERANEALAASNAALEARVEERTAELRRSVDEQKAAADQLQESLEAQRKLNEVISELSVPVIPISARTLVVPLVGNIDTGRADQVLSLILERVEGSGAHTVVVDVTGVAIIDTQVAGALLRVAEATRLLGAETVLVGIRPEVAQALVNLGVELGSLRTAATLQEGLRITQR